MEINFTSCPRKALEVAKALVAYIKAKGAEKEFRGSIDFNPFKRALKHETAFPGDITAMACELLDTVKDIPALRVLSVDSNVLSNAGASIRNSATLFHGAASG